MSKNQTSRERVEMIPIDCIHVLNPRTRSKTVHRELIENIQRIGLKRPITVSPRHGRGGTRHYDLICGQGRLEAFQALNQTEIPAFVVAATSEDCLVMSLVENVARRQHRPIDLMREIGQLRERGHTDAQIAEKIGVTASWVNMITGLLDRGEERLLAAVEAGQIPLSMATVIARSSESEIQNILADAYEQGYRGKKLTILRRLIELRSSHDKLVRANPLGVDRNKKRKVTPADLRRLLEREAEKRRVTLKKAELVHDHLVFATQALKDLFTNADFVRLLRAQNLASMPELIQKRIQSETPP